MTAISLVISDVDGTLVTPDKRITKASARAAQLLYEKESASRSSAVDRP